MSLRISGKNALVQLVNDEGTGSEFDISGSDTDGRGRANAFNFNIAGNVVEAMGYNEDGVEPVPTGQTRVTGSMTVFYSSDSGEVEEYLEEMYTAQHAPADCTDVGDYDMYIYPEGDCTGKTLWTMDHVIISDLDFQMPVDGLMIITFNWQAWDYTKETIADEAS
jgi:hypothetical protein